MRILQVLAGLHLGGAEQMVADLSAWLQAQGHTVLVANLTSNFDTTKCRVMLILEKDFFNHWLTNRKFVLYDTIDNRIVILSTKLESYFTLLNVYGDNDSIIDKYLITRDSGINEIWEMEYSIVKGRITKKVIYDPIY